MKTKWDRSGLELKDPYEIDSWEGERKKTEKGLQWASGIFVTIVLIGIVWLSIWSWGNVEKSLQEGFAQTPSVTPTITPTPGTPTPQATPTLTSTSSSATAPTTLEGAKAVGAQHFLILLVIASIGVLIPALLLFAFAVQRVPKMSKDIKNDLMKLGLGIEVDRIQFKGYLWDDVRKEVQKNKDLAKSIEKRTAQIVNTLSFTNLFDEEPQRPSEIEEQTWYSIVEKSERIQSRQETDKFGKLLESRFGGLEYILPLIPLTLILMASFVWVLWPQATDGFAKAMIKNSSLHAYFTDVIATMGPAITAVIIAYLFGMYQLVRRYHRSDLTPGGYWNILKRLFIVFLLGLVIGAFWRGNEGVSSFVAVLLGLIAGIFPVKTLSIFIHGTQSLIQAWFDKKVLEQRPKAEIKWGKDIAQGLYPRHELALLDDLDEWDVERIEEEGIIGVQGLATCDISHLVVWTPFPTSQVVDWIDQAILFLTTGAEPDKSYATTFRIMGLRGATDLLDAASEPGGVKRIVSAAKAIGETTAEDPISSAQLAALRANLKVKDTQDKVKQVSDSASKDENKDKTLKDFKSDIESAIKLVQETKTLTDTGLEKVKAGGDLLKNALDAATSLQARFKSLEEKAEKVTEKLKGVDDSKKLSELSELKSAISALNQETTKDPDAKSLVKALVDALDKIEHPLADVETDAKVFEEQITSLKTNADGNTNPVSVPQTAKDTFKKLTEIAQNGQKFIKSDTTLANVVGDIDKLVGLLTNDNEGKLKKLIEKEKITKDEAAKLVELVKELWDHLKTVKEAIAQARAKATGAGTMPPLTEEVLEVLLSGMEKNANLRRIYRYLTAETMGVSKPIVKYINNKEFLDVNKD